MADFWYENAGKDGNILRVVVKGQLNAAGSDYLLDCAERQIDSEVNRMIIDCSGLSFISSMGLGTLVRANSRVKNKGGEVNLACVPGTIAKALSVVGLDRVFKMYPTVEEAIAALEND